MCDLNADDAFFALMGDSPRDMALRTPEDFHDTAYAREWSTVAIEGSIQRRQESARNIVGRIVGDRIQAGEGSLQDCVLRSSEEHRVAMIDLLHTALHNVEWYERGITLN